MKVVILAGGYGTRLSERTDLIPKPMAMIGAYPILWHIMTIYSRFGFNDFVVAGGYKVEVIKDYFLNFHARFSDFEANVQSGEIRFLSSKLPDWKVSVIDTGIDTMTGGRILRLKKYLDTSPFHLTYGDGVCNVDLTKLTGFHQSNNSLATLTAVHPKAHYGELEMDGNSVTEFLEKPQFRQSWINGGFMVLDPKVLDYIEDDQTVFEREPLEQIAKLKMLTAFRHTGFWQCMDTLRDLNYLNSLFVDGTAPWLEN